MLNFVKLLYTTLFFYRSISFRQAFVVKFGNPNWSFNLTPKVNNLFKSTLLFFVFFTLSLSSSAQWINEIHYDNDGADTDEGIEIAGPAGTDLSCWTLVAYNGSNGESYISTSLSGIIPDEGCGYGAIWFNIANLQNGSPDGIALVDCSGTVVQFLSYEGAFTATDGPALGMTSTDIGVSEGGSTPVGQSLQLTGSGTTYGDFTWQSPAASSAGALNSGQTISTCSCPGLEVEPTNEVTDDGPVAGCTSATINWTLGSDAENAIVVYSTSPITGTPTDGVNYNVGSTISPGEEVIYNGSGNTTIISGLSLNTTYYYAIFEYNGTLSDCEENYLTGGITGSFTTPSACQDSYIQSINYNACTNSEGTDEIVVVSIGDDPVAVDSLIIELPNSTWCNTSCGTNTIVNNPTYINDLNNLAGCSLFTYCDPIPAGATLMIFTGNPPSTVIDYSGSCGGTGGPYCAIFLDNSSLTGNFSNNSSTPRVTTIHFGSSSSSTVSYTATDGVGDVDGATADFDASGNVTYVGNSSCVYPLAVSLKSFNGHHASGSNHINWSTVSEENNDYFALYHSMNGKNFDRIGMVQGSGNTTTLMNYTFEHKSPEPGINYYKLESVDYDGTIHEKGVISIDFNSGNTYYDYSSSIIHTKSKGDYNVVNLAGQIVKTAENTSEIPFIGEGLYIVQNLNTGEAEKLIIHSF